MSAATTSSERRRTNTPADVVQTGQQDRHRGDQAARQVEGVAEYRVHQLVIGCSSRRHEPIEVVWNIVDPVPVQTSRSDLEPRSRQFAVSMAGPGSSFQIALTRPTARSMPV